MHRPIREYLEKILLDAPDQEIPQHAREHLERCSSCREVVGRMREQSLLVRSLRADVEVEPYPGFYARVLENIDAGARTSFWSALLEPAFAARLAFTSTLILIVLGGYVISTEPRTTTLGPNSPEVIMAVEPPPAQVVGFDRERDRQTMLVKLATYRE